jgi:TetR/AcrR family transcriptional repressor of bet genes
LTAQKVIRGVPRALRRALRRSELVEACRKIIARRGLTGITLNDVAAEAGCSYGVIAFHFQTKDHLLLATLEAMLGDYEALWSAPETLIAPDQAAAELVAMIEADFHPRTATAGRLAVWAAFWAETPRVPAYRKACNTVKQRYNAIVARLVQRLVDENGAALDATLIAEGLNALIDGWWIRNLVAGSCGPAERQRGKAACTTYLAGFFPAHFTAPLRLVDAA